MKKIIRMALILLVVFLFAYSSQKTVRSEGNEQVIIDDGRNLLNDEEEKALEEKMLELTPYGDVAFVSVYQFGDTGKYAQRTYYSFFGTDSGLLFVIDVGQHNIWIYADGEIYRTITKANANTITDNVYHYASEGNYFECAYEAFDQALTLLKGSRIAQPMKYISNALIALVIAVIVDLFYLAFWDYNPNDQNSQDDQNTDIVSAMTTAVSIVVSEKIITKSLENVYLGTYEGPIIDRGGGIGGHSGGGSSGGGGFSGGGGGHSF